MNSDSIDYFSTQFHRQSKLNPTQYRKGSIGKNLPEEQIQLKKIIDGIFSLKIVSLYGNK